VKKTALRLVVLGLILGSVTCLTGCSPDPAAPTAETLASQPVATGGMAKAKGGNVMDTTVYPAPPGVKTGLEGGKKN